MTEAQRQKTRIFTAIVIVSNVLGNSFLSRGMRGVEGLLTLSPLPYIKALFNPWVALGVSLLILWLLSSMALLSWADLSYVLPVTAMGYVLVALTARIFLHEQISPSRWTGIALIVAGVALVSRTTAVSSQSQGASG